jgi:flagellar basal body rod protein FlgG
MNYGLYLSAQGAQAQSTRLDVISNNLANSGTSGFKKDLAIFQDNLPYDRAHGKHTNVPGNLNDSTGGVSIASVVTDFENGSLQQTGGTFDLGLAGPGFFQVENGSQKLLTRNGNFVVNNSGELVTEGSNLPVLSQSGGRIVIPGGISEVQIAPDGTVNAISLDGNQSASIGQIGVFQPASYDSLEKIGNSMYVANSAVGSADDSVEIKQGFLEGSGTNSVSEMMQLIEASRTFETNMNMIKFHDDALGQLLQSAAR